MLGGPAAEPEARAARWSRCAARAVRASAGAGAVAEDERARPHFAFDPAWLRALTATPGERLTMIRVEGDSMAPTLDAGDDILVDHDDPAGGLRDGIYVLRVDGALARQAAGDPSVRRAGDGPVGQSHLSRLARPRARRADVHRPRDLGRATDCLSRGASRAAAGRSAQTTSASTSPTRARPARPDRAAAGEAPAEADDDRQDEEKAAGHGGGGCHARRHKRSGAARAPPDHGI